MRQNDTLRVAAPVPAAPAAAWTGGAAATIRAMAGRRAARDAPPGARPAPTAAEGTGRPRWPS